MTNFTQNHDDLLESFIVSSHNDLRALHQLFSKELILSLCLNHVGGKRHQVDPVTNEHGSIDAGMLELDNSTQSSDSIVSSVVELEHLLLLFFLGLARLDTQSSVETLEAVLRDVGKGGSTMLCSDTDTINSGLSDGRTRRVGVGTDLLDHILVNFVSQEIRTEVLDHIIQQVEQELLLGLILIVSKGWHDLGVDLLSQLTAMVLMSLEEKTQNLDQGALQLIFLLNVFFEHGQIIIIQSLVLLSFQLFFLVLFGVVASILRFVDKTENGLLEQLD